MLKSFPRDAGLQVNYKLVKVFQVNTLPHLFLCRPCSVHSSPHQSLIADGEEVAEKPFRFSNLAVCNKCKFSEIPALIDWRVYLGIYV
jgi:hypothetical protein